jgi:hypothetical protein
LIVPSGAPSRLAISQSLSPFEVVELNRCALLARQRRDRLVDESMHLQRFLDDLR